MANHPITTEWAMLSLICMHNKFHTSHPERNQGDYDEEKENSDEFLVFLSSYPYRNPGSNGISHEDVLREVLRAIWTRWWPVERYMNGIQAPPTNLDVSSTIEIINFLTALENSANSKLFNSHLNAETAKENTKTMSKAENTSSSTTLYSGEGHWKTLSGTIGRVLSRKKRIGERNGGEGGETTSSHTPTSSRSRSLKLKLVGASKKNKPIPHHSLRIRFFGGRNSDGDVDEKNNPQKLEQEQEQEQELHNAENEVVEDLPRSRMKRRSIRSLWQAHSDVV